MGNLYKFGLLAGACAVLFLSGCVVGPWKMYDGPQKPRDQLAVLPVSGQTFRIDQVNGERVGNIWQGHYGLSEIHLKPGRYELLVYVIEEMDNGLTGWTLKYVTADLEAGDGYTVKHEPLPENKARVWLEDDAGHVVSE